MKPEICEYCNNDIDGLFMSTGTGGYAHKHCYHQKNPYQPKEDFMEVLCNCDDQVLVRRLLHELVPEDAKEKIVNSFNATMIIRHRDKAEEGV